jgi:hypothetical protein
LIKAGSTGEPRGDEDRLGRRGLGWIPAFRISGRDGADVECWIHSLTGTTSELLKTSGTLTTA